MAKDKKRSSEADREEKVRKKKAKKSNEDQAEELKQTKTKKVTEKQSKSKEDVSPDQTPSQPKPVQLDSLQSIFAPKDTSDGVFTLFGGDPVEETLPPP
jgi:hypothetical protein